MLQADDSWPRTSPMQITLRRIFSETECGPKIHFTQRSIQLCCRHYKKTVTLLGGDLLVAPLPVKSRRKKDCRTHVDAHRCDCVITKSGCSRVSSISTLGRSCVSPLGTTVQAIEIFDVHCKIERVETLVCVARRLLAEVCASEVCYLSWEPIEELWRRQEERFQQNRFVSITLVLQAGAKSAIMHARCLSDSLHFCALQNAACAASFAPPIPSGLLLHA